MHPFISPGHIIVECKKKENNSYTRLNVDVVSGHKNISRYFNWFVQQHFFCVDVNNYIIYIYILKHLYIHIQLNIELYSDFSNETKCLYFYVVIIFGCNVCIVLIHVLSTFYARCFIEL